MARLAGFSLLFLLAPAFWASQTLFSSNTDRAPQWVNPETYAVKRFREILTEVEAHEEKSPAEKLIALRARLQVAERKLDTLKAGPTDTGSRQVLSTRAEILHYQNRIAQTEALVLRSRAADARKKK